MRVLLCLLATAALCAGENPTKPMPREGSTPAAWRAQAEQIEVGEGKAPHFTGALMWRGRADREYLPFHQWELRIKAGSEALTGLRLRVIPLGGDLKPLNLARGQAVWLDLGTVAAGAETDCSYKLNTPAPVAYRVELTWRGGEGAWLAPDRQQLPKPEAAASDQPLLRVLEPAWDYDRRNRAARVVFMLRNDGGRAGTGVTQTIVLRDAKGEVVGRAEHVPEGGTVPPSYAREQTVIIRNVPPFATVAVSTATAEGASGGTLDPGRFTEAAEIEVAEVRLADGRFHATARNGTREAVQGLRGVFTLRGSGGSELGSLTLDFGNIAAGARASASAPLGDIAGVTGYGMSLEFGAAPAPAAPSRPSSIAPMLVDGIELTVLNTEVVDGSLVLNGRIANRREATISGLVVTIDVTGPSGTTPLELNVGDLAAGEHFDARLVANGLSELQGLSLRWRAQ